MSSTTPRLPARAAGSAGSWLGSAASNLRLAWACFRRRARYDVVFTDGEQVGLPLAASAGPPGGPPAT